MKILLVDDDRELGKMLSEYLTAEGFDTSLALTGTDVLRQVRKSSRMPIIMLTAKGDNIDRVIGLEMGADDYMPKPCYPRELVARLRAVLRRFDERPEQPAEAGVASFGDLILNPATRTSLWRGKAFDLTASEFNLLELLIRAPDRVVSKDDLSEKGLGRRREAYDRSVDVHISNIRQKLSLLPGSSLGIETVRSIGYRIR